MRVSVGGVLVVIFAAVATAVGTAGVAPDVRERIVPGASVGKVRLGMSFAQVKRVLGQPESTIEIRKLAFGKTFVELGWNFGEWRVGFVRERGRQTVVRIGSSARAERTREGIGPGVLARTAERTYGVRCLFAFFKAEGNRFADYWCVANHRNGTRTAYVAWAVCKEQRVYGNCPGSYPGNSRFEVRDVWVFARGQELPVVLEVSQPLP